MSKHEKITQDPNKDFDFNITLFEEFLTQNASGDKLLLSGLEIMFKNYFKNHRFFETEDDTEKVLEAYHFCSYFLTHKTEVFNTKKVA